MAGNKFAYLFEKNTEAKLVEGLKRLDKLQQALIESGLKKRLQEELETIDQANNIISIVLKGKEGLSAKEIEQEILHRCDQIEDSQRCLRKLFQLCLISSRQEYNCYCEKCASLGRTE